MTTLAERAEPDTASPGADVLVARGEDALHGRGDLAAARTWFARGYDRAVDTGEPELMATAALGEGGLWVHERRSAAEAAQVEEHQRLALTRIDPASPTALRLRTRLSAERAYRSGDADLVLAAVERARLRDEPVALAEALSLAHHCMLGPGQEAARAAVADELLRVAARTRRPSDVLMGLLWRTVDAFAAGDPHAERSYAELAEAERRDPHGAVGYVLSAIRVMLAVRAGRLAEAEDLALEALRRGDAAGDRDAAGWYGAQLFAIRWYQGRAAEMAGAVTQLASSPTLSVVDNAFVAAQAVAAAEAGDRRTALGALARICGPDLARVPRSSSWLAALCGVVEAAAVLDEPEPAAAAYRLLLPHAHLPAVVSLGVVCFGSVEHALGVASLTVGEPERAVGHLRAAVANNYALGHWPAAALSKARLDQAMQLHGGRTARPASCTRHGRRWRIDVGGRSTVVDDSVGVRHLATLISNPGADIPAVELAGADLSGRTRGPGTAAQPVLDPMAVRQYRSRLQRLRPQIDEAQARGSSDAVAALRAEADWLLRELRAQTGLGGRPRQFADDAERARIAVGKAIRRALQRISLADPEIGQELRDAIQTGMLCCYRLSRPA